MNYEEWKDSSGFLYKEWRNETGLIHREDGPAQICYNPDGPIEIEYFYVAGESLGYDEEGFWALWEKLTEGQRQAPGIIRYLVKFS